MPDLHDGESIEVPGSSGNTYTIKNVGGVYACNCMAWRTQSAPVDRRTCKHLRRLRGDAAEDVRIGAAPATKPAAPQPAPQAATGPAVRLPAPKEAEAIVLEYHLANGRFAGFRCRLGDGQAVAVTAGFAEKDKDCPPPVGGIVTLRYQQVTAAGVPVGASYAGITS